MPQGGTVEVAAQNLPAGDPRVPAGLPPARYVKLSIADRGSGLGPATSYAIARNHGGLITVRSTQGAGSTFEIYLPASGEQARKAPGAAVTAPRRSGRFLVMDDDALVLSVAGELLCALGHEAVLTAHGEEAVERYREAMAAGRPFDAVILDLTVRGGLGGQETVRRLQRIDPGVRAVVSSGYSEDAVTSHYREHGFRAFLRKPYTAAQLNETLNALFP
jgi:CheY-like chemotaxis protein